MPKKTTKKPAARGPLPSGGGSYVRGDEGKLILQPHPKAGIEQPAVDQASNPAAQPGGDQQKTGEGQ